jgi:hypothetical protein
LMVPYSGERLVSVRWQNHFFLRSELACGALLTGFRHA